MHCKCFFIWLGYPFEKMIDVESAVIKKSLKKFQTPHQIIIGYNGFFNASTESLFSKSVPTHVNCQQFDISFICYVAITAHFLPLPAEFPWRPAKQAGDTADRPFH